ncbi:MAG: PDZ domain-containing protein [Pyrinomonadaceae bacterium]
MTIRRAFYVAISLSLTAAIGLAQQPPTPPAPPAPAPPDAPVLAQPLGQAFSLFVDGGSFLGVYAEDINRENMARYNLREARGTGITSIVKDSPAEKAGLRKDDVILRFDGENVTSVRKLNRMVSEVAPDQSVRLTISRGGSEQEVSVTIGKRKDSSDAMNKLQGFGRLEGLEGLQGLEGLRGLEGLKPEAKIWKWEGGEPGDGFVFSFGNNRRIGVSTTTLTKQLADYFGVNEGKGVLVTSVAADSAAAKAGLKAGDIITAVDGEKVEDAGDLARCINKKKEGDVTLTVIRNKSQRNFTVTPKQISNPSGLPGTAPQVGRRVILPRITLPTIPEMNISIPRIELPVIPEINVEFPARAPRGRIRRVPAGPI